MPFEPDLGGNHSAIAVAVGQSLAYDLLRPPEAIDRRRVDDIEAKRERSSDRLDRICLVGAAPHPAADGPSAETYARHFQLCAFDVSKFNLDLAGAGLAALVL